MEDIDGRSDIFDMGAEDNLTFSQNARPKSQQLAKIASKKTSFIDNIDKKIELLNDKQKEAVLAPDGALLVLAGVGTGKTEVLTTRIAYKIAKEGAHPSQCLAVTLTNNATHEMRLRVEQLLGGEKVIQANKPIQGKKPIQKRKPIEKNKKAAQNHQAENKSHNDYYHLGWMGTFHSLGARILCFHPEYVGLRSGFTILDTSDQRGLLKQLIKDANIDEEQHRARDLSSLIDKWKNFAWQPKEVPQKEAEDFANGAGKDIYEAYQAELKRLNAADFGDLLMEPLRLFQKEKHILEKYQNQFRHIFVDEYQDTSRVQRLWLKLLAGKRQNICCVGDDDQSIYRWRGAQVENILQFEKDYQGAKIIHLEHNYRSTRHILGAASGLIKHNKKRFAKTFRAKGETGNKVQLCNLYNGEEEVIFISNEIERLVREKHKLSEIAVLVRTRAQMRPFEDRFIACGLPYRVMGGPRFYERKELKDAIAYLRLVVQKDDDLAFKRICNTPKRKLGDKTLARLHQIAEKVNCSLFWVAKTLTQNNEFQREKPQKKKTQKEKTQKEESLKGGLLREKTLKGNSLKEKSLKEELLKEKLLKEKLLKKEIQKIAQNKSLANFVKQVEHWSAQTNLYHTELTQLILEESGYLNMLEDKSPNLQGRLNNLTEMVRGMGEFETLEDYLEHIALVSETSDNKKRDEISLMTLHSAKGSEFETVFLAGWEDGLLPHHRSLERERNFALEEDVLPHHNVLEEEEEEEETLGLEERALGLEEERRLAHMGLARAKKNCFISFVDNRVTYAYKQRRFVRLILSSPSRFIDEIPKEHLETRQIDKRPERNRVFHKKFGYGDIIETQGDIWSIAFDEVGIKRVMRGFCKIC